MKNILASVTACLFTIIILFGSSCAKLDTTDLGTDLLPAVDNVHTFELILDAITDNKLFDDTTRMVYGEAHALGIIENDLEFGKTTASINASFTPTAFRSYPFVKRDTVVIDSVVLSLAYVDIFGDSNSVQQIEVREMSPHFPFPDSLYYLSEPDFPVEPDLLASTPVSFLTLNDAVEYKNGRDTIRTTNELRVHLDTTWARRFVEYDTTNAYQSDSAFKHYFKGLEIKASEASALKRALAYFNLSNADRSRITFYCRVENNGRTDTIAPYFSYTNNPHANLIRRTPANNYLATVTNAEENDQKLYLQSSPGSYATVRIPGIDTLTNRVIHRAELILDKHPSEEDYYQPPDLLFVDALNAAGDSVFTIRNDFITLNQDPWYDIQTLGGIYRNNQYVFNLTRYVQSIVTKGFPNYTLRVYAPFITYPYYMLPDSDQVSRVYPVMVNTPVAKGRVVVYGGGAGSEKRVRLRIIYSRI